MPEHLNKPEEAGEMTQQAYNEIVKVRHEKLKALRDAGKDPFVITKYPQTDYSATAKAGFTDVPEGQLGKAVCMAGRMMSKRVMGKASFAPPCATTRVIFKFMCAATMWATRPMPISKSLTLATSLA